MSGLNEVQGVESLVARQRPLKLACLYELPVPEPIGGKSSSEGPKHGHGRRAGREVEKVQARAEITAKPATRGGASTRTSRTAMWTTIVGYACTAAQQV